MQHIHTPDSLTSALPARRPSRLRRGIVAAALVVTGCVGLGHDVASAQLAAPRKLAFTMTEYKYMPNAPLKVKKGETITFTFTNKGKLPHEAFIGTKAQQDAHEKEMITMDGKQMADGANHITLKPGETKTFKYTFTTAGKFELACHELTHYSLGMKVPITVS